MLAEIVACVPFAFSSRCGKLFAASCSEIVQDAPEEPTLTHSNSDRELGMHREINRRDFLNGCTLTGGGALAVPSTAWSAAFGMPETSGGPGGAENGTYYPPAKTGLRGSHDGSWEVAHAMRDGKTWPAAAPDSERYDLIVVGGGISGLAAAYF